MRGVSESRASRLRGALDERVSAFLKRSVEGDRPGLRIETTCVMTHDPGRVVRVAVAVHIKGCRETPGAQVGPSQAETFRTNFLRSPTRRALRGVKRMISDAHGG